jgi:5-methylcytosine-specific restriction protein B
MTATNTILYGPPGTGKTYQTFRRAVAFCDGGIPLHWDEAAVRRRYDALRGAGRITFVTFHPSYGYEEFVEGLRPYPTGKGEIAYSVLPGTFRHACNSAERQARPPVPDPHVTIEGRTIYKISLGATWSAEGQVVFEHCIRNHCILLGWGENVDFSGCDTLGEIRARLDAEMPNAERPKSQASFVHRFKNELKVGDLVVASLGNTQFRGIGEVTGEYEHVEDAPFNQMRTVRWLYIYELGRPVAEIYGLGFNMRSLYRLDPAQIKYEGLANLLYPSADPMPHPDHPLPHVLIIDEINRANISKVFGELITLIEPDKRKGAANEVTVRLPYSQDEFSVPANLHLLCTMNTADRSIALLDTALRRRFRFVEVMPDPEVLRGVEVDGVDLARVLERINQRIEVLLDRDHTLGHAYLIGVASLEELDGAFRTKVLPLLMEYFHENASKVRRVLNDVGSGDFVERIVHSPVPVDGDDDFDDEPAVGYRINPKPFPVEAFLRIYAGA